jgi:hypothetical protein
MNTKIIASKAQKNLFVGMGMIITALVVILGVPGFSLASTYAYVDQVGEVKSFSANGSAAAIVGAPNIDEHSGVILLTNTSDYDIVGDRVSGM